MSRAAASSATKPHHVSSYSSAAVRERTVGRTRSCICFGGCYKIRWDVVETFRSTKSFSLPTHFVPFLHRHICPKSTLSPCGRSLSDGVLESNLIVRSFVRPKMFLCQFFVLLFDKPPVGQSVFLPFTNPSDDPMDMLTLCARSLRPYAHSSVRQSVPPSVFPSSSSFVPPYIRPPFRFAISSPGLRSSDKSFISQ